MKKNDSHSIDFAALDTLRLVFDLGSFSAAAEKRDTNQSSISYTIDRLRQAFGDPLFIRQGSGIMPTDRCSEIVEATSHMLDSFDALTAPTSFNPSNAEATITISCNFYERLTILPALLHAVRKLAPMLHLNIIQSSVQGRSQLKTGECDLLISPMVIEGGIYRRHLFSDHYVCVMDNRNPLAGKRLEMETYAGAPHVEVNYNGTWRSFYLQELDRQGIGLNRVIAVPSPGNLDNLLKGTDLISTVPNRIAKTYGPEIHLSECPCPSPFDVNLFWTERSHHSPMHRWFRKLIEDVALGHCVADRNSAAQRD